jgi:hypothetical protein
MTTPIEVLRGLMQLIEDGVLVRNTACDGDAGWAMRQLPLFRTLANARAVLADHEAQQQEPIRGIRYLNGEWSLRNYEAWQEDQKEPTP